MTPKCWVESVLPLAVSFGHKQVDPDVVKSCDRRRARQSKSSLRRRTRELSLEPLEPRTVLAADVVINEFMAINDETLADKDDDYRDWIELFNQGDTVANLEGWVLRGGNETWTFPTVTVKPLDYLIVFASGKDKTGTELHTNFRLRGRGGYLGLIRPDGMNVATEFNPYPEQYADVSYGSSPESDSAQYLADPTPGSENSPVPNVVITEFMPINEGTLADEDGNFADWIEIHNAGSTNAHLSGWTLRQGSSSWPLPPVRLAAGQYIVLFASGNDRREVDGVLHTNFKLDGEGESLSLLRPDGLSTSQFLYPSQRPDVSYGLTLDGSVARFFETPTPGKQNVTGTAGDANRDGQFDQQDIVQVLQADKYLSGDPATFAEGDWTGDGEFDPLDIVAALQTDNYLQGPYALRELDREFNLYADKAFRASNYGFNSNGLGEKFLRGGDGTTWYYLTTNGQNAFLYRLDSTNWATNELIATLDSSVHDDPSLLHDATVPVNVDPLDYLLVELDRELNLYADELIVSTNYGLGDGLGRKNFRGGDGQTWYHLRKEGDNALLYRSPDALIATLDSEVFDDPTLLHDANADSVNSG